MLEQDMDKVNDQERKLDSQIMKLVEQYASCDRRSAEINDERKQIRDNAEKLGFASSEFQEGVKRSKKMTKTERDVYEEHVGRIVGIVEGKQAELWPSQAEKNQKREERKAEKAAKEPRGGDELDAATDANPKSDPAAGGAGKRGRKAKAEEPAEKPWPDDVAANSAAEQTEGEALLATAGKGEPMSQSAIARERLENLGLDKA
jgi:hypothetical protein